MSNNIQDKIDGVAEWYSSQEGFDPVLIEFDIRTIKNFFFGDSLLEIGCSDGEMTKHLISHFKDITIVDGSDKFISSIDEHVKNKVTAHVSLIEDYEPGRTFDTIIMAHLLEHLDNPSKVLSKVKNMLSDSGRLILIVPNAHSLHRLAAVKMGILQQPTELNSRDKQLDHKRVYTFETLAHDIQAGGLTILNRGGIFLKPLSNQQIMETWNKEMVEAFFELGKEFPKNAAEIFAVCAR